MSGPLFDPALADLNARVVYFPVRHHSPMAARLVHKLAIAMRPDAILIEGPADFNQQIAELALPHTLPIAIYSYAQVQGGQRHGAFYPFCIYSPEWQAIQAGFTLKSVVQFIDMPWAAMLTRAHNESELTANRYNDGPLQDSGYIKTLCREVGVETFDALWDTLFEVNTLSIADYVQRMHAFCAAMRSADPHVRVLDSVREAYMAAQIRTALATFAGRILVVTGGFHSGALLAQVNDMSFATPNEGELSAKHVIETGIALTPYSYERLDSLTGYESGMPNPGFITRYGRMPAAHRTAACSVR